VGGTWRDIKVEVKVLLEGRCSDSGVFKLDVKVQKGGLGGRICHNPFKFTPAIKFSFKIVPCGRLVSARG
jgi:hypothetical protein